MLLRSLQTPELALTPGRALAARVVSTDGAGRGSLSIAGTLLEAELPAELHAGQDVRLVVREVSADRVVLSLSDQTPAAVPTLAVPLPGGGTIRVTEQAEEHRSGGRGRGAHTLTLRYDAPRLGPIDFHFTLDEGSLQVAASLVPGGPLAAAQAQADSLREALSGAVKRTVTVTVSARRDPLEVYA